MESGESVKPVSRFVLCLQCLGAILVFLLLLVKLILLSPILILSFGQLAIRTLIAWVRKRRGYTDD